jgi:hypothetical protein
MTARARIGATLAAVALTLGGGVWGAAPAEAAPPVKISKIYYDSPGTDNRSTASLNAEYVVLTNTTTKAQTVTGWSIRDAANHVYTFPTTTIAARKSVTLRTGKGTNSGSTRYWQQANYIWNNTGDTASLRNKSRAVVHTCSYGRTKAVSRTC